MFTLIKVMVVLAIIGIIAGIGVPQLQRYQASANAKKRLLSIEQFKTACQSFLIDFDITNPADGPAAWENSKGQLLVGGAGLNLNVDTPFDTTDVAPDNNTYTVFDFIKGRAAALNIGGVQFCGTGFPALTQVDPADWANAEMNNVGGGVIFYDGFNNATGL